MSHETVNPHPSLARNQALKGKFISTRPVSSVGVGGGASLEPAKRICQRRHRRAGESEALHRLVLKQHVLFVTRASYRQKNERQQDRLLVYLQKSLSSRGALPTAFHVM